MNDAYKLGFVKRAMVAGMTQGQAVDFWNWSLQREEQLNKQASPEEVIVEQLKAAIRAQNQ
jgi:hypothetical protein